MNKVARAFVIVPLTLSGLTVGITATAEASNQPIVAHPTNTQPSAGPTDHYVENSDGSQTTTVSSGSSSGTFTAAAVSSLPFNYTVDFTSTLRGRDMQTSTNKFCNDFKSTFVANPSATPYMTITLRKTVNNAPDPSYESVTYPLDGVQRGYCWTGHSNTATYHFDYALPNFGWQVKGSGDVHG